MFKQLILLKWASETKPDVHASLVTKTFGQVKGATHTGFAEATAHNAYGDTACHLLFPDQATWEASGIEEILDSLEKETTVEELEAAAFSANRYGVSRPNLKNGVHRSLLFKVGRATPDQIQLAIDDLAAMPSHIPEILNWGMNPIVRTRGLKSWSHIWEQEFADSAAYRTYLDSDYHCYYVSNWWDPEISGIMVLAGRNHASALSESVMAHY